METIIQWRQKYYKQVDATHMCDESQHVQNAFIYCYGPLLEAVNYHALFKDSKDFVDMPLKNSPDDTQKAFDKQFGVNIHPEDIDPIQLNIFVEAYFSKAGSELINCTPSDWTEFPAKIMSIQDPKMREWALNLNRIWKTLCKRVLPEIANQVDRYSLIYMPYEFIAPGGRFRELYYWDATGSLKV
uniref:Trehalase n=1 Tax=Ditylenchus dipsaci TaxID=166011 RepID=A0A915D3L7_9BILA